MSSEHQQITQKFGIVGYGIVGKATHHSLLKNQQVIVHDIAHGSKLSDLADCDVVFFCMPSGSLEDLAQLTTEIQALAQFNLECSIVIRSTVPLFFCQQLEQQLQHKILYMPEFLRERQWQIDCEKRPLIVGHNSKHFPLFLATEECVYCSFEEAELLKLFSNTLAASKVVFANHFFDLSQHADADYSKIADLYARVEHQDQTYLDADENLRAFGGKCLPKDLEFVIQIMEQAGLGQEYFTAIQGDNKKWPVTIKKS